VTGIAIGPPNVIQRILAFTGAGGSRYFYIPADVAGGAKSTVLNDNTSISLLVDFFRQYPVRRHGHRHSWKQSFKSGNAGAMLKRVFFRRPAFLGQ